MNVCCFHKEYPRQNINFTSVLYTFLNKGEQKYGDFIYRSVSGEIKQNLYINMTDEYLITFLLLSFFTVSSFLSYEDKNNYITQFLFFPVTEIWSESDK